MPAVSILVPTFNREHMLKECLDSLLATTAPCEILVGDNASEDGTTALVASYDDPRIRYFRHETNLGPFANFNFLLSQASQDYICIFGDDDIALPGCFEKKLAVLDHNPDVAGVYSPSWILDEDGNLMKPAKVNGMPDFSLVRGRDDFGHLLVNCCISWQTLVFRRELYDRQGGLPYALDDLMAGDWDYLIAISKGRQFACIDEPTVGIRIHAGSAGNKVQKESGRLIKDMMTIWRKWLVDNDDPPVVTGPTWITMANMVMAAVQSCYGQDQAQMQTYLQQYETLRTDYFRHMNRRFYAQMQGWLPDRSDVDAAGLPIFREGLTPLPIDTLKRLQFFHQIDPAGPGWREVLDTYNQAFTVTDNVELVLWLDPALGMPVETVSDAADAALAKAGKGEGEAPDILLLTDPLTLEQQARLYTAAHVIVPAGDPRQIDRGAKLAKLVMTHTEPEVWRRTAEKFLGALAPSQPETTAVVS